MNCPDCNHNPHKVGQCKHCNCGESELSRLTSTFTLDELSYEQYTESFNGGTLTFYGFNRGHRVLRPEEN